MGQHKASVSCQEKHSLVKRCQLLFTRHAWSATYSNGTLTPDVVTPLLVDPGFVALSLRGCVMLIKQFVVAVITRLRNVIVLFQTNTCFDIITRPRNNDQLHGHGRWHCSITIPNGRAQTVPLLGTSLRYHWATLLPVATPLPSPSLPSMLEVSQQRFAVQVCG